MTDLRLLAQFEDFGGSTGTAEERVREIYVPEDQLGAVFEGAKDRVLLNRSEYDALDEKVRAVEKENALKSGESRPPCQGVVLSADFRVTLGERRAIFEGTLEIESLTEDPIALPLACENLRVLAARWDDGPAALDPAGLVLLIPEKGRKRLTLQMVGPLHVDATRQELAFALPRAPRESLALEVGGDVD
ncbi:MAG TPA: hypothetical protein DEB39_04085, partial [Planctomycetaceae bacterium]|nr:hypothetical protein [Planctomycetaceae bacterium]